MSTFGDLLDAAVDATGASNPEERGRLKKQVNEQYKELATTLRLGEPITTLVLTPGVGDYSLTSGLTATDVAQIRDVFYLPVGQTVNRPLRRSTPARVDELRGYSSASYPGVYALAGVDTLQLAPLPTDAGTLMVRYVSRPLDLAAESDVPTLVPVDFHDVIWLGAATKLARITNPARAQALDAWYRERLGDLRSWLTDQGGVQPVRMQRAGTRLPDHDRSVYPGGW